MNIPLISETEFKEFFICVNKSFPKDAIYFDGRCTSPAMDNHANWIFYLVNQRRSTFLFVPSYLAFFFINIALSNISPLPDTITTCDITCEHMQYLHSKYRRQQLTMAVQQ